MKKILFLFCLLLVSSTVKADCPNAELAAAKKWTSVSGALNAGSQISITESVVIESTPGLVYGSITVSGNGKLFIKDGNIELRTGFLKVNRGASFTVGGSDCPITNNVKIILHGSSADSTSNLIGTDNDGTEFGSKGLVVANGGSISMWGKVSGITWTRIATTAAKGTSSLTLKESVEWKAGDSIVISSTDYSDVLDFQKYSEANYRFSRGYPFPDQNEKRVIQSVSGDGKTITLNAPLTYTHWGKDYQFAEVGLLNRQIVITSDENSENDKNFGGHVLLRKGPKTEFSGIEITRMGQRGVLARYPFHFHNMSDVYDTKPFIQHSSIHNNFQRCLVVHETNGATIRNNVAYNTSGHCYFIEDGYEHGNVFDKNLGVLAKPLAVADGGLLPSDERAAVYWITNPNNTWTNNVAAGGHHGFWFSMPERPRNLGLRLHGNDPFAYPRRLPLGKFDSNVAHSNRESGVHIDDMENADGSISLADYSPMLGPYIKDWPYGQGAVEAHFTNILAYKNRESGIWGKTSLRFSKCILQDNARGFMVNGKTVLSDSLITGETDNIGNPVPIWNTKYDRSTPSKWGDANVMLEGHSSYDNGGPQFSVRNKFVNFVSTKARPAAALVPLRNGPFMLFPGTQFGHQLEFENANQFFLNYGSQDCEYGWNILDADGKITNYPGGAWIQSNETIFKRDGCNWKEEWNAYVCPNFGEGYVQVTIRGNAAGAAAPSEGYDVPKAGARTIRGIFHPLGTSYVNGPKGLMQGANTGGTLQLMHNLIARKGYSVEFFTDAGTPAFTPNPVNINIQASSPGDWLIVAVPYPSGTTFTIKTEYYPNVALTKVNSFEELTHLTYFFDEASKHLYFLTYNNYDGSNPSDAFGYKVADGGNYRSTSITASCGNSCQPALSGVPKEVPVPKAYRSDNYIAVLNGKQTVSNPTSSSYGRAYFYFQPNALSGDRELTYKIFHDVPGTANTISIKEGAPGSEGTTLSFRSIPTGNTASYGIWKLTRSEWEKMAMGNLYVSVADFSGKEVLRGRILCDGTCAKPPKSALSLGDVCKPSYEVASIYSENNFAASGKFEAWNKTRVVSDTAFTGETLCGATSWSLKFSETSAAGGNWWAVPDGFVYDASKFKSVEMFIKTPKGSKPARLGFVFSKESGGGSGEILAQHTDNFVIDETGWTRVRFPLAPLTAGTGKTRTIYISNHWTTPSTTILVDEFRLSTEEAAPITELSDIVIPQAADFYKEDISPPTTNIPTSSPIVGAQSSASALTISVISVFFFVLALF